MFVRYYKLILKLAARVANRHIFLITVKILLLLMNIQKTIKGV